MTNEFLDDDEPAFDVADAQAHDAYTEAAAPLVPAPSVVATTKPLPVPRARRQLKGEADAV